MPAGRGPAFSKILPIGGTTHSVGKSPPSVCTTKINIMNGVYVLLFVKLALHFFSYKIFNCSREIANHRAALDRCSTTRNGRKNSARNTMCIKNVWMQRTTQRRIKLLDLSVAGSLVKEILVPDVTLSVDKTKLIARLVLRQRGKIYWPIFQLAELVFFRASTM